MSAAAAIGKKSLVPPVSALSSLRYADFWALSSTGRVPLSVLVKYVAVCVRVCRQCHQSGGTDVVDLPDVLLPEDQYLHIFDTESDTSSGGCSDDELVELILGGTDEVDLLDILLGWCSGLCLIWKQIDPPGDLLVVCLGISLDWWCGIHCFWTHPMVCLVVST